MVRGLLSHVGILCLPARSQSGYNTRSHSLTQAMHMNWMKPFHRTRPPLTQLPPPQTPAKRTAYTCASRTERQTECHGRIAAPCAVALYARGECCTCCVRDWP